MSATLGEKLRSAREERGISISEVAEQTRISRLYLEGIDTDDYKSLPGGIFNKGFIRSYAKYVGIDEQEALLDYARIVSENETREENEDQFKAYRPEVLTDERSGTSIVPTVIFAVIILGLMTAGILFLVNYIQNQQSEPIIVSSTTANNSNVNNDVIVSSTPAPPAAEAIPTMDSLKVEFMTIGDVISLGSVTDGKKGNAMITPGTPVFFEPKQSLKLRYSKSRAQFAQLSLNGRQIVLPTQSAPRRSNIEFDITPDNLAQIWESGQISTSAPVAEAEANPAEPSPQTIPAESPAQTSTGTSRTPTTPKPASTATVAVPKAKPPPVRATPTPIIVGRPRVVATPRPNPN